MATRFYLPSSGTAPIAPAFDAVWNYPGTADRLRMVTTKSNSVLTSRSASLIYIHSNLDYLIRQYVSDPLEAQTITGTFSGVIRGYETMTSADARAQIVVRVVSNNGTTVRGTLISGLENTILTNEFGTSLINRFFPVGASSTAVTSVTAQAGDRIILEVGVRAFTPDTGNVAYLELGDPTTLSDLPLNETNTASGVPWIEFSQTLAFQGGAVIDTGTPPTPRAYTVTAPRRSVPWDVWLCDLSGNPLQNISRITSSKQMSFQLNRPASMQFAVPSDHAVISTLHSDGEPMLAPKVRTIKAYRKEPGGTMKLRFAGFVEDVQDTGSPEQSMSMVNVFDPMHHLSRRLVRDSAGRINHVVFTNTDAAQIARTMVDRANLIDPTGVTTLAGYFELTEARTVAYDFRFIAPALLELAESHNGFDMEFLPVDRTDGILVQMSCYANLGVDLPDVIWSWDEWPATARQVERTQDGEALANYVYVMGASSSGGDTILVERSDATSIAKYRRHEILAQYNDITDTGYLTSLADEELRLRKNPKQRAVLHPIAGKAAEPFSHFWLGDTIRVKASSKLRGGFSGVQRVYAVNIVLDSEGGEHVQNIITSPE